ncbi:hypothetical protein MtrunA17_Chr8g0345101 [Medicago truncatula]|uniref:Uncharacterized protein n=1 Tax=Medicago truncatula TaxID=3880 RepID=A0A396GDS3_MEDTR|nr:hypothetical protein MtrunA17_Chr8g0345101 [Medicago truncatula]
MGYDMCLRDSMGFFLLAVSSYVNYIISSTQTEAIALLEAIQLAISRTM